jgi:hypothetical protein
VHACMYSYICHFPLFDALLNCCRCCEFNILYKGYLLFDCTEYSKDWNMGSSSDNNRLFLWQIFSLVPAFIFL